MSTQAQQTQWREQHGYTGRGSMSEFPEIEIRTLRRDLEQNLTADASLITISCDTGCLRATIDNPALAREIIAATRRLIEAHIAQLQAELAITEREHA